MTEPTSQFDDPALKDAIHQLKAGHRASAELREKVIGSMASEREPAPAPARPRLRIGRPLALAASMLLVIGAVVGYLQYQRGQELKQIYVRNDALLDAMIAINEAGTKSQPPLNVALSAPLSDADALAAEATKTLHRPVPSSAKFVGDGWKLDAASLCSAGTFASVRFHFTRDGHGITVISMPREAWTGERDEGNHYELVADGHAISGYIHGGSLTCVVGDTSVPSAEVTRLRDQLQTDG